MGQSRRKFMRNVSAAVGTLALPSLLNAQKKPITDKKKIVCIGGHPDDPESGCGGTLALLSKAGHEVTIIYLTTREADITGKSHADADSIRKQEAINASGILNAKPVFA